MSKDSLNKVVVVTGGAAGIGYQIADHFLQKGAKVSVILDIDVKQGNEAARSLNTKYGAHKAVFYECDVTRDLDDATRTIYDTYKHVDVLVNNAGIGNDLLVKETIDINLTAVIQWSFKYWERMRTDKGGGGGTIINISSVYGFRVDQFMPVYHATKFAVLGFSKSLGHEYNFDRSGVRVIVICPGFTETGIIPSIRTWDEEGFGEDVATFVAKQVFQKPDAVGRAVVEAFEIAPSGTAWLIEGAEPISLVP